MSTRTASCRCGQLRAVCAGKPVRVSVCHCLDCQKRSGSAFAAQARWAERDVTIEGVFHEWQPVSETGKGATFRFCPVCSATIAYVTETMPGIAAIPIGAFADPHFPAPDYSVYEGRKHQWVAIVGDAIDHYD